MTEKENYLDALKKLNYEVYEFERFLIACDY